MIRAVRYAALTIGSLLVVAIGSILLFWLGRPIEESHRGELVIDPDVDSCDAGRDVDEEERHL